MYLSWKKGWYVDRSFKVNIRSYKITYSIEPILFKLRTEGFSHHNNKAHNVVDSFSEEEMKNYVRQQTLQSIGAESNEQEPEFKYSKYSSKKLGSNKNH